jgi:hypothetical protein
MLRVIALSAAALMFATPAAAAPGQAGAGQPGTNGQVSVAAKDKKICKADVGSSTGSIMPKKICHTQAEWDAMSGDNSQALQQMRDWQRNDQMVQGSR